MKIRSDKEIKMSFTRFKFQRARKRSESAHSEHVDSCENSCGQRTVLDKKHSSEYHPCHRSWSNGRCSCIRGRLLVSYAQSLKPHELTVGTHAVILTRRLFSGYGICNTDWLNRKERFSTDIENGLATNTNFWKSCSWLGNRPIRSILKRGRYIENLD